MFVSFETYPIFNTKYIKKAKEVEAEVTSTPQKTHSQTAGAKSPKSSEKSGKGKPKGKSGK